MARLHESEIVEQLNELGNNLLHPPSSITQLLSLLDEVECLFSKMRQAPSKLVEEAFMIPKKALIADELFSHSDPDVRVTVASCLNEVMRLSAPNPPYDDEKMREIFELLISSFNNLSCEPSRCYSKAVLILKSVAKLRSCVVMLDLGCDSLVTKMLDIFQKNISSKHPHDVLLSMVNIMSVMIQESDPVSLELLKILLDSIKMENLSFSPASWEMGVKILEGCADKLRPFIMETVLSMGCCLEDYAPILSSICKPEDDTATTITKGSPIPVNNEPSGKVKNEPSGKVNRPVQFVQGLKAVERGHTALPSSSGSKALGTEGTSSKKERKPSANHLEHKQNHQGAMNDDTKKNDNPRKGVALKAVKEEDGGFVKGRPSKKDIPGVSGDKALRKKNDVPGESGSAGKKLLRPKEFSGGSGNKSKTVPSRRDKVEANDTSRNQKKWASSDDDVIETPHGRKNYKDDLVGCRIKVWWPLDRRYYEGTITSFEASARKHRVDYDDGDEEVLNLRKERWEFLGDETPTDIAFLFDNKTPPPTMPKREASAEEKKEISQTHIDEKEITSSSEFKLGDTKDPDATTVLKSEIPDTLPETKRVKLFHGQDS